MSTLQARRAPPFTVTRLSHIVLNVRDLEASRRFYEELVGLTVTSHEDGALYLRGVEERCHHSLVLCERADEPTCERVGFRVLTEDDLDCAKSFYDGGARPAEWVDVPHQGRTLHVSDDARVPLEFCARMPTEPRRVLRFESFKGAAPARIDHAQTHVADIQTAARFYDELGFRMSEFASRDGTPNTPFRSVFLARKGNANDIVLLSNEGPRLHHVAYVVHDASTTLLRVCDLAASMGLRNSVEWGPNRHGLGYEQFLYLHDPDGHRIELLSHPYQLIDLEEEPYGWSTDDPDVPNRWGPSPPETWRFQASHFRGVKTELPGQADVACGADPARLRA